MPPVRAAFLALRYFAQPIALRGEHLKELRFFSYGAYRFSPCAQAAVCLICPQIRLLIYSIFVGGRAVEI